MTTPFQDPSIRLLPVLNNSPRPSTGLSNYRTGIRWAMRAYRAIVLVCAAALLHFTAPSVTSQDGDSAVLLEQAKLVFPTATRIASSARDHKGQAVFNSTGQSIGLVFRTSPQSDHLVGYSGPSDVVIGVNLQGRIERVALLSSQDTPDHVASVKRANSFWAQFTQWNSTKPEHPNVEGVAGSTLTSLAIAEAIQQRLTTRHDSLRFPKPLELSEAQQLFGQANALEELTRPKNWYGVRNASSELLGYVVRSSPATDNLRGYGGPTETLIGVAADQKTVTAIRLRSSYDTPDYVDRVREDLDFLRALSGRTLHELSEIDFAKVGIEGVSGATQTSFAVAQGLKVFAQQHIELMKVRPNVNFPSLRSWGLTVLCLVAVFLSLRRHKLNRGLRRAWQIILVAGFGLWLGDLLSIAMLVGWSRFGVPWSMAPALVVLAAVSLGIPWGTQQQVYCHHICPHGAVQEWLAELSPVRWRLPTKYLSWLNILPALLLIAALILGIVAPTFDLTQLEPFDAWTGRSWWAVTTWLALGSLLLALFVPQGYCRFGCPTGALLKFVRTHGSTEGWGRRDTIAGVSLALIGVFALGPTLFAPANSDGYLSNERTVESPRTAPAVLAGEAFGTQWSVKFRSREIPINGLGELISAELERIESRLSHWRPTSETSLLNSTETTFEIDVSQEMMSLLVFAQGLHTATDGTYDVTVAPLTRLWGYGPNSTSEFPPNRAAIETALGQIGFSQLTLFPEIPSLRKRVPRLQFDLGSILQGYAVDRLTLLLDEAKVGEYLIDVGGELFARGSWEVAIDLPFSKALPVRRTLTNQAMAVSSLLRRDITGQVVEHRHIVSPQSGDAVDNEWKVAAVIANSCRDADGWATALLTSAQRRLVQTARERQMDVLLWNLRGERCEED